MNNFKTVSLVLRDCEVGDVVDFIFGTHYIRVLLVPTRADAYKKRYVIYDGERVFEKTIHTAAANIVMQRAKKHHVHTIRVTLNKSVRQYYHQRFDVHDFLGWQDYNNSKGIYFSVASDYYTSTPDIPRRCLRFIRTLIDKEDVLWTSSLIRV